MLREKITPYPEYAPHAVPWQLNRELLMPETAKIVFVVDIAEGKEPRMEALDLLTRIAAKYGERPAEWILIDQEDAPKIIWDRSDTLECPNGPLDADTSYVFIRFTGSSTGSYGETGMLNVAPECGKKKLYAIKVDQDSLARYRFLWLTRRRLEENTLLHEYGHILGLGSNPAHGYFPRYPSFMGGAHCINPNCPLSLPRFKAILYNAYRTGLTFRNLRDYCAACQRDIEWAKRYWRTGEMFPESPRLPQIDLTEWILQFGDDSFNDQGGAFEIIWYGKAAMPGLMERMATLPGGDGYSPRAFADWIARIIVANEAIKIAGAEYCSALSKGDQSSVMLKWWQTEGARFMSGDDWDLPSVVGIEICRSQNDG